MKLSSLAVIALTLAGSAEARVDGPRITSPDLAYGALQDEVDGLLDEYRQDGTTDGRRVELLGRLGELGRSWYPFCSDVYGAVARAEDTDPCAKGDPKLPELCAALDALYDPGDDPKADPAAQAADLVDQIDRWQGDPKGAPTFDYQWVFERWPEYEEASSISRCGEPSAAPWCLPEELPFVTEKVKGVNLDLPALGYGSCSDLGDGRERCCTVEVSATFPPYLTLKCEVLGCQDRCAP